MASCPCKPRKFDVGTDANGATVVQVLLDATGALLASPHHYYADGTIVDAAGAVVAAPEFADFAAASAATVAYCAPDSDANYVTQVMEDDDGNPYIVVVDRTTGELISAWDVVNDSAYAGSLADLQEIQDRDVEVGALEPICVDNVNFFRQITRIFEADHAAGSAPLSETTAFFDVAGATVADPTAAATTVTLGACPVVPAPVFSPYC